MQSEDDSETQPQVPLEQQTHDFDEQSYDSAAKGLMAARHYFPRGLPPESWNQFPTHRGPGSPAAAPRQGREVS